MIGEMMTDRYGKRWTDEAVLAGACELDSPKEGVVLRSWVEAPPFLTTLHGPMRDIDGAPVQHGARCLLCEWAYSGSSDPLPSSGQVTYGYGSADVSSVLSWATYHRGERFHVDALMMARRKVWQAAGVHKHV